MQRIPVESSDIVAIGYDPKERLLEIEFHGQRIYQYKHVEPEIYEQFMRAESYGRFFSSYIDRHYRYERVEDTASAATYPEAIAFVTGNSRKFRDLQRALEPYNLTAEQLELPVEEIQSAQAEEIAIKKAKRAYALARRPVVVSDLFWNILALKGFPGAYMNEVTKWLSVQDWLALMADKQDRTVYGTDTLVYYDGKRHKAFSEQFSGSLAMEPYGTGGASIDRLLVLDGQSQTVAALEEQASVSSFDVHASNLGAFAKWFHMQRRLGKG